MPAKRKHDQPLTEIARRAGVSLSTIKRRSAANLPMGEGDRVAILPAGHSPAPGEYDDVSLDEAKRRRHVVGWQREELELRRTKGEMLERAAIEETGVRIGAAFSAHLSALIQDSPGWSGLSEEDIRARLSERIATIKKEIEKMLTTN